MMGRKKKEYNRIQNINEKKREKKKNEKKKIYKEENTGFRI